MNLLDSAQETERKMIEMSALNHLFSTHVLQQAQQIEILYQQVCYFIYLLKSYRQMLVSCRYAPPPVSFFNIMVAYGAFK